MPRGRPSHRPAVAFDNTVRQKGEEGEGRVSLVDRLFDRVMLEIQAGRLAPGQRLHSVRQLADECEVSRDTVARAYDKLVAHGHIESRPGSGFYVRQNQRQSWPGTDNGKYQLLPDWWRFRLVQPAADLKSTTGLGLLPADWLDETGLGKAMRAVARASARNLSGFGSPLGYLPLRQQLQAKLREVQVEAPVSRIMVTAGATQALHLVIMANLRTAGEPVLVEDPCSFMLRDRLMAVGLNLLNVPRDDDGPNLEKLREHCIAHRPRFFFCSSVLHNPTSGHISPHKAYQILRLADEFKLTIVEDDTYSDLMPVGKTAPVTRLASLDQLERVIYIGSFSKTVAPGLRLGYICANQQIMDWLLVYRTVCEISGSAINERVLYQLLSHGGYRHHCAQLRSRLDECRQPVIQQLTDIGCSIDHQPSEGMYLWVTLPDKMKSLALADELLKSGHLTAPGPLFSSESVNASRMRFNISRTLGSPLIADLSRLFKARTSNG